MVLIGGVYIKAERALEGNTSLLADIFILINIPFVAF